MRSRKERLFMNVYISKNAELFHKAVEDIWVAEQVWKVTPNNAVWHCAQAAEKMMKGLLRCLNEDYDYGHDLSELLNAIEPFVELKPETIKYILYLNGFGISLRYKHMKSDPTTDEASIAISRTKQIVQEFHTYQSISDFIKEAEEVHLKILKASSQEAHDKPSG